MTLEIDTNNDFISICGQKTENDVAELLITFANI